MSFLLFASGEHEVGAVDCDSVLTMASPWRRTDLLVVAVVTVSVAS